MVPSSSLVVSADGECLTCSGFSRGETVRFGSLEFITDRYGDLSLSPRGATRMPPSWAQPTAGHRLRCWP
jgi:hypothetical protein